MSDSSRSASASPHVPFRLRFARALRRSLFLGSRTLVRAVRFDRLRTLGAWLGELQFALGFRARRRIVSDVAALFGRPSDDAFVAAQVREAYRTNNAAVLEILKMFDGRQDEAMLLSNVEVSGLSRLRDALAAGRGAILLANHAGNGALFVLRLVASGVAVSVVYREARMMDAGLFDRGMPLYGIEGILATEGLKAYARMLSALRRGGVVYMMGDQGTRKAKDGIGIRFLGKEMSMPAGPAQLARHARAPVLAVDLVAVSPKWGFEILPAIALEEGAGLEADVETLLRVAERLVLHRPQWWSWHHRRWRHHPLAAGVAAAARGHAASPPPWTR